MTEVGLRKTNQRKLLAVIRDEPLVHFLAIAGALFVANALFAGDPRETITITAEDQAFLLSQQENLLLRSLTGEERQGVVDDFIEEEILVREARARGFESSSRIRSLLIQNMRFFLATDIPAASAADYRRHYEGNPGRFMTDRRFAYDHVLFRDADAIPEATLQSLRAGADHRGMGDQQNVMARLAGVSERQLAAAFGADAARAILAIDDDAWHGPFFSDEGAHFLRIVTRYEPRLPPYEDIENWVETDWLAFESRKRVDEALALMRERYNIIVEPLERGE